MLKLAWFVFLHSAFQAFIKKSVQGFDFPNSLSILLLSGGLVTLAWSYVPLDANPVDPHSKAAIPQTHPRHPSLNC